MTATRAPRDGELCSCGRPAIVVYVTDRKDVPYCGIPDGGRRLESDTGRRAESDEG